MTRCTAITASGKQCSRSALPGRKSCKQHTGTRRRRRKPRARGGEFEKQVKLSDVADQIKDYVEVTFDRRAGHYSNRHPIDASDVRRAAKQLQDQGILSWAPEMDRTLSADDIYEVILRTYDNYYAMMQQVVTRGLPEVRYASDANLQFARSDAALKSDFRRKANELFAREERKTPAFRPQGPRRFEFFSTARTTVQNPDGSVHYELATAPTVRRHDQGDLLSRLASGSAQTRDHTAAMVDQRNRRGFKRGTPSAANQAMPKRSALSVMSSSAANSRSM